MLITYELYNIYSIFFFINMVVLPNSSDVINCCIQTKSNILLNNGFSEVSLYTDAVNSHIHVP